MADGTVNYVISVTKDGSGLQQALEELLKFRDGAGAAGKAAADLSKDATETGNSFEHLAGKAFYVRGAIDAIRAAAMDGGTRAAFYAIDETIRGMVASGLKIGTILPVLASIAAVVASGVEGWRAYQAAQQDAAAQNDFLTQTETLANRLSDLAQHMSATGRISTEMAIQVKDSLSQLQVKPVDTYQFVPGLFRGTAVPTGNQPDPTVANAQAMLSAAQLKDQIAALGDAYKITADDMARMNNELDNMTDKTAVDTIASIRSHLKDVIGSPEQQHALDDWGKLQNKILADGLAGIDKQRWEIATAAAELEKDVDKIAAKSGGKITPDQVTAAKSDIAANSVQADQEAIAKDNARQADEAAKEQAESENKIREAAASDAAAQIKALESSITLFQAQQGAVRSSTVAAEYQKRIALAQSLYFSGEIDEQQYTEMVQAAQTKEYEGEAKVMASKKETLAEVTRAENELAVLQDKINASNLTGEARKQAAIKATTDAMITQIQNVGAAAGLTQKEIDKLITDAKSGQQITDQAAQESAMGIKSPDKMIQTGTKAFSSGLTDALVSFADGTKTAKQAFEQFAASFLENIAKMIMEQAILNALGSPGVGGASGTGLMGMLGFAGGGTATANSAGDVPDVSSFAAAGGFFPAARMAADGIQSVSSPTYFPKFNVVAGEAGMEMLTVLAHPTFRNVGGMDAVVGNAGNRRLAISNESDLEKAGGAGAGGMIHIRIEHTPETQATIIQNSINGAVTEVTHQMKRNSPLALATKQLTQ